MFHAFAADADFALRFQPFQLYGDLPAEGGVDKGAFFLANSKRVRPDESDAERARRRQGVVEAWRREGLDLKDVYGSVAGGRVGNSLDAQRLILLARAQGREDACIEAVYAAADANGTPSVYWMTQDFNENARLLYDRIGTLTRFIKYSR